MEPIIHARNPLLSDFNPLLSETLSPEASSSISSEAEDEGETEWNGKARVQDSEVAEHIGEEHEEEDAICRRTRARYSLANFTLDELETFLQETDDEDDLPNVDDEEEYRKFLATVLQGGEGDGGDTGVSGGGGEDEDDDEENDADFEVEIEEALMESDVDDVGKEKEGRREIDQGRYSLRRPETRQKKRQKDSAIQSGSKLLGQAKIPLRPLLPSVSNANDWTRLVPESIAHCPPSITQFGHLGFTASQVGQLHCLIHEHVQLLVQIYTLCIFESSKQHIANDAREMLMELVGKRDEALDRRKNPYPGICFRPPNVCPSVAEEHPRFRSLHLDGAQDRNDSNAQPHNAIISNQDGLQVALWANQTYSSADAGHCSKADDSIWLPSIRGPVMSVLDVAPLSLVGGYMTDVLTAIQEISQRRVQSLYEASQFVKEPLFPLPHVTSPANESSNDGSDINTSHLMGQAQLPKKSLAATLVESTKKQSVALVPKELVKLAERFIPMFNSALFPHKPPPPAVANRVLFTDAEDGLLAMGLMEYNKDWKAIQQRFLPCKTEHQIYVRQKNRISSKAPENPIKNVRRMKTSKLTAEEQSRIHEGLKVYKLDWMSVWKFLVPYRDPSLLPRQWKISQGTQKSYKTNEAEKAKRRMYESMRRKSKKAATHNWHNLEEKENDFQVDNADGLDNSADDNMDDEEEAYVHEAFLDEWTPGSSKIAPSEYSKYSGGQQGTSQFTSYSHNASLPPNQQALGWNHKTSCRQINIRTYRMRRRSNGKCVKLAPDLPPVNLPSSVRVISQSAFKRYEWEPPISRSNSVSENPISIRACNANLVADNVNDNMRSLVCYSTRKDLSSHDTNPSTIEENTTESDAQMHPFLVQAPEDGYVPRASVDYINPSYTFSVMLKTPLQKNHPVSRPSDARINLGSVDFHPFLQSADNENSDLPLQSTCVQMPQSPNSSATIPLAGDGQGVTSTSLRSSHEKADGLDLDIRLSSAASRKVIGSRRDVFQHKSNFSVSSSTDLGTIDESQKVELQRRGSSGTDIMESHNLSLTSNDTIRTTEYVLDERPNAEIVMEQEELSDSDEDAADNVEFEREEMADSEGDELGCEQLNDMQSKDDGMLLDKIDCGAGLFMGSNPRRKRKAIVAPSNKCSLDSLSTDKGKSSHRLHRQSKRCLSAHESSPDTSAMQERRNKSVLDTNNGARTSRPSRASKRKLSRFPQFSNKSTVIDECKGDKPSAKKPRKCSSRLRAKGMETGNSERNSEEHDGCAAAIVHPTDCQEMEHGKILNPASLNPLIHSEEPNDPGA